MKMEYGKATPGQRLREWRKSAHLKLVGLSEKIDVAASSLSELENEKSLPSADTLSKLCHQTNLNIIWLLTGHGSMIRDESGPEEKNYLREETIPYQSDQRLNELINKLIRVYRYGDPEKIAHLNGFLEGADPDIKKKK